MTFTGTLIEELMATVERAEQRAQSDAVLDQTMLVDALPVDVSAIEPWMASGEENANYEQKFLGVA
jgi:hypothetical protein